MRSRTSRRWFRIVLNDILLGSPRRLTLGKQHHTTSIAGSALMVGTNGILGHGALSLTCGWIELSKGTLWWIQSIFKSCPFPWKCNFKYCMNLLSILCFQTSENASIWFSYFEPACTISAKSLRFLNYAFLEDKQVHSLSRRQFSRVCKIRYRSRHLMEVRVHGREDP